jgi:glycosyltransferase involved in cell wall biosynthesis
MTLRTRARGNGPLTVAHLTTVDMSLRFLLLAQLLAVQEVGGVAIGISAHGPWVAELEAMGIRHVPLASSTRAPNPRQDARAARELWDVMRREHVDVLHTHNPKPGIYGRVVGRAAGVPIVVNTVHGLYATEDDPLAKRLADYSLEAVAARCSDAELVQNEEDLALMRRLRIAPRASLLGNGVDLARFDAARTTSEQRRAQRADWRAGEHTTVVGSVGRLVREKGFVELFDAVERIARDDVVLVVAGGEDRDKPDALPPDVVARARARGVRLLGHRDDVERLYPAMDVFVLASHREGYPRAAMEAAASGLPVVATDIRGCRQVVDDGVTGILVAPSDPAALAAAIARLAASPEERAAMARAARARAEARFDERQVVATVMHTYREVAGRKELDIPGLH